MMQSKYPQKLFKIYYAITYPINLVDKNIPISISNMRYAPGPNKLLYQPDALIYSKIDLHLDNNLFDTINFANVYQGLNMQVARLQTKNKHSSVSDETNLLAICSHVFKFDDVKNDSKLYENNKEIAGIDLSKKSLSVKITTNKILTPELPLTRQAFVVILRTFEYCNGKFYYV